MQRALPLFVLLALLVALPAPSRADEDERPELSLRIYRVGALTHPRPQFQSQFPPTQNPDRPGDALLLISSDPREPTWHLGTSDELVELLRHAVQPGFWEEIEGAEVATLGTDALVVRATAAVHEELARTLERLERRFLRMVTVDLHAVRVAPAERAALTGPGDGTRLDAARAESLLAADPAGPCLRLLVENGSSAEAFGGFQRAFLRGHRIDVAQSAQTSAPVAGVANPGLAAVVRPVLGAGRNGRIRLAVRASLTQASDFRETVDAHGAVVELPVHDLLDIHDDVWLEPGAWGLLGGVAREAGASPWMLLARATPVPAAPAAGPPQGLVVSFPAERPEEDRALETRMFDIATLTHSTLPAPGTGSFLWDSLAVPAQEEMPEPATPLSLDAIVELVRAGAPDVWEDHPAASIEARGGTLIVHHTPATLTALGGMLERLARERPAVVETTVRAVEVSPGVGRALGRAMAGQGVVLTDEARAILAAALDGKTAHEIGEAQVTSTGGARNTVCSGRHTTYLKTYAAEIAESAARGRPVTARYLAGFEVEVEAHPSAGGTAVLVEMRLMHTREDGAPRTQRTEHGPIELPSLATGRVRASATLPYGRTAWVATTAAPGGRRVLYLATARLQAR